jgi:hypothetical protein
MKRTIKSIATLLTLLSLASCLAPAQRKVQGSNPKVQVELLFEVDGCKVYRFYDGSGRMPRYFTKCDGGSSSSVGWFESCGKNCVYYVENTTAYPKADSTKR